jgi:hypothetical protein
MEFREVAEQLDALRWNVETTLLSRKAYSEVMSIINEENSPNSD